MFACVPASPPFLQAQQVRRPARADLPVYGAPQDRGAQQEAAVWPATREVHHHLTALLVKDGVRYASGHLFVG